MMTPGLTVRYPRAWDTATTLPLGSLLYVLFCTSRKGWGWDKFLAEANEGEGLRFPKGVRFYVSYILPLIVLFIFVMGYWNQFGEWIKRIV